MWSRAFQKMAVTVLTAFALGCADRSPTSPETSQEPVLDFTNGPSDLANVFRFEDQLLFAIGDAETDLLVWYGLTENPADLIECGGTEGFDLASFQIVGDLTGVFKFLAKGEGHLHVYQLSTFTDFCTSVPLGQGTGRIILNDNDLDVSGTGTNSFGGRINGRVTLAAGGTAHVIGEFRFLIGKDGIRRDVVNAVRLAP